MDSFQGRRFAGGGDHQQQHQPQQNPFPNPYHHQPQPATAYSYPPPPPPHPHHYPSPPPPALPPQHQPPPPPQQQWGHPEGHLQHHHAPLPPPYPQPMPPFSAQPMPPLPHHQYPPLPASHHVPPPLPPHQHRLPSPPAPPSAYPPPPHQGWGGPSWTQHQGWECSERNLPYNTEDDWAARAKAWAAAKSVTDHHQTNSQVMPVGRIEEHNYTYHDQYQAATGPPTDTQQSSLSQSTNQQLPHYVLDQQKHVNHLSSTPFTSGLISYVADARLHYNAGEEAMAQHEEHNSPARNFGSTSSIFEQEVPYSYSSIPGNRDAVNQLPLPVLSMQEGFIHPQSALPDRDRAVEQSDFTHGRQPTNYLSDASNKPLDFEPRPASELESHPRVSYGPADPARSMGVTDHDAVAMSVNAWTSPIAPGVFPQLDQPFVPQPSLGPHPPPAYGRLPGPNLRPSVPPANASFGLVTGTSLNQTTMFSADASGAFNLSERPKKAAVPNWLREEIIKNKSVLATTYASHQSGSSQNSMGSEDDDKTYRKADQADNKSVDSIKSTDDEEEEEDDAEAGRSAAINQEIKRVLTEVLLKVTDELFDEIAMKVLNEDDLTNEVSEHKEHGNHKIPVPVVSTPKASAKVMLTVKENKKDNGVNESYGLQSAGGDILGLASYASDEEEDDDDETDNSKSLLVQGSNGTYSGNELKDAENENILINKGEPFRGPHNVGSERVDPNDASQKSNARNHVQNSLSLDASISDGKLHNLAKEHKGFSDISSQHVAAKSGLASEFSSDDSNAPQSKLKTTGNNKAGVSVNSEDRVRESKNMNRSSRHPEKRSENKESVKKESTVTDKANSETSDSTETVNRQNRSKLKENIDKRNNSKEISRERSFKQEANARDSDSRGHGRKEKDNKMGSVKDKKERDKEEPERKKEKVRDEKEGNSRRATKDSRHSNRRSPSPSHRGRNSKESSLHGHGSISSDEPSEISKKRRLQSRSPSPTRSWTRQVSRSPHRKHSHRRHSPYSSERRRSRSGSPVHRRR